MLLRAAALCRGNALTAADFSQLEGMAQEHSLGNKNPRQPEHAGVAFYSQDGNLRSLEAIEDDVVRLAIGHYQGRMSEVARRLRIGRSTLYRKLGKLGVEIRAAAP
jgi:DNA-binding NtrC family response regulator